MKKLSGLRSGNTVSHKWQDTCLTVLPKAAWKKLKSFINWAKSSNEQSFKIKQNNKDCHLQLRSL